MGTQPMTQVAGQNVAIPAILRLEGGAVFVCLLFAYHVLAGSWLWFALLFLLPDLSMLGYLINARVGAWAYNVVHSYVTPIVLAGAYWLTTGMRPSPLWIIWPAHIAFDRLLGYGLKYQEGFHYTHLGLLGSKNKR